MATKGEIAKRAALVRERAERLVDRIAAAYGVEPDPPAPPAVRKNPELNHVAELERFVNVVEAGLAAAQGPATDVGLLKQENDDLREALAELSPLSVGHPVPGVELEMPGFDEIVTAGIARYLEAHGPWKDNEDNAVAVEIDPLAEAITAAWTEAWALPELDQGEGDELDQDGAGDELAPAESDQAPEDAGAEASDEAAEPRSEPETTPESSEPAAAPEQAETKPATRKKASK